MKCAGSYRPGRRSGGVPGDVACCLLPLQFAQLYLEDVCRKLQAREEIWREDTGEAPPMAVRTNHVDEKLPLYATEAMSPSRLHRLKAAAVSLAVSLSVPWLPEVV